MKKLLDMTIDCWSEPQNRLHCVSATLWDGQDAIETRIWKHEAPGVGVHMALAFRLAWSAMLFDPVVPAERLKNSRKYTQLPLSDAGSDKDK